MFSFTLQQSASALWQHKTAMSASVCLISKGGERFDYNPITHASLDGEGHRD